MNIEDLYNIFKDYPVICTDTRKIIPNSLFFALKGSKFNGNIFAQQAIKDGKVPTNHDSPESSQTQSRPADFVPIGKRKVARKRKLKGREGKHDYENLGFLPVEKS